MLETSLTPLFTLPLQVSVQVVLYIVLGVYAVFSAILYYHWNTYATDDKVAVYTLTLYFAVTVPILIAMSILAFTII